MRCPPYLNFIYLWMMCCYFCFYFQKCIFYLWFFSHLTLICLGIVLFTFILLYHSIDSNMYHSHCHLTYIVSDEKSVFNIIFVPWYFSFLPAGFQNLLTFVFRKLTEIWLDVFSLYSSFMMLLLLPLLLLL